MVEKVDIIDEEGNIKPSMISYPRRNQDNKLNGIETVILEESTLANIQLWQELWLALPEDVRIIPIGDLNQQRPPFGRSVLEYYATRLPRVLLSKVYRQDGDSPVTALLQSIMKGEVPKTSEGFKLKFQGSNSNGILSIQYTKKKINPLSLISAWESGMLPKKYVETFGWNQYEDVILIPFNKSLGTIVINRALNDYFSVLNGNPTYEIVSGFQYFYWAVGDFVLHNKRRCVIQSIEPNAGYSGLPVRPCEVGMEREKPQEHGASDLQPEDNPFEYANAFKYERDVSHKIVLYDREKDSEFTISTQGDISALEGAHAITSYKAQGLQWRRVFIILHASHNSKLTREMLYTMASRTEHALHIMCEEDTFIRGIAKQEIVGNSLEEKVEWLGNNPLPSLSSMPMPEQHEEIML